MRISGTFIDEISHDIPHQNWGVEEWKNDFAHMKSMGIDTVIVIRCGHRQFLTYPSAYLIKNYGCYKPPVDLLELFCQLSTSHGMSLYIGLYDSGQYWDSGDMQKEVIPNQYVTEELWNRYGHHPSFRGWYLSMEISRKTIGAAEAFRTLGLQCKNLSQGLPTFISPWIDGKKAVMASTGALTRTEQVSVENHQREWNEIFATIEGAVDAVAFQDGHIGYEELDTFFTLHKQLATRYHMECWTNAESFDRDMPIKFLPIKWEKLRLKLEAASRAGFDKAITFEFSHFMSPQSAYPQAHHLYRRYLEYAGQL